MMGSVMIEIIVAVIGLVGVIITVVVSGRSTRNAVTQQLTVNQAVTQNEIDHIKKEIAEMKTDIKEHNNYAKLFNESVAVLKEKISVANHRIKDLEQ